MNAKVSVITVSYNSADVLRPFLQTLPYGVDTIIVDNASADASITIGQAAGVRVIALSENSGFGTACNVAATTVDTDFLLFTNPDIRLEAGAIEAFVDAASRYPDAAFNPRIYSTKGKRVFRRWSRLLPGVRWCGPAPETDCTIPVLTGACIFIRRQHFEQSGGFDPAIFLFHEDDDLSLRLRQEGVELRLAASAVIRHDEGNSSSRSVQSGRIKGEAMGRSLVHVMRKHGLPLDTVAERRRTRRRLLLPHVLWNATRRAKHLGFLRGLNETESET